MKVKNLDFATVILGRAPGVALLAFSFLANSCLSAPACMLQVYGRVLPSGALDPLLWVTLATLVAVQLSMSPR